MLSKLAIHDRNWVSKLSNNFSWRENIQQRNLRCGGSSTTEPALPNKVKWLHCGMRCFSPTHAHQLLIVLLKLHQCCWAWWLVGLTNILYRIAGNMKLFFFQTFYYDRLSTTKILNAKMSLYRPCTGSDLSNSTHFGVILFHYRKQSRTCPGARTKVANISLYLFIYHYNFWSVQQAIKHVKEDILYIGTRNMQWCSPL